MGKVVSNARDRELALVGRSASSVQLSRPSVTRALDTMFRTGSPGRAIADLYAGVHARCNESEPFRWMGQNVM